MSCSGRETPSKLPFYFLVHKGYGLDVFVRIRVLTHIPPGRVNTMTAFNINYEIETNNFYNAFNFLSFYSTINNWGSSEKRPFMTSDILIVASWTRPPGTPLFRRCLVSNTGGSPTLLVSRRKTLNMRL